MASQAKIASWIFRGAGIYGILVLAPQYLIETGALGPVPSIGRPEQFYGFIGVALVWQFVFLLIARDVHRYRPLMPLAVLEKAVFGVPVVFLYAAGRIAGDVLIFGLLDLVLGVGFTVAFVASRGRGYTEVAPASP